MSKVVPTYAEFIVAYPAFATLTEPVIQRYLDFGARLFSLSAWGDFYSDAISLNTAHSLAIDSVVGGSPGAAFQGAVGPISSASAAGISTSFNSVSVDALNRSDVWYMKTSYGQEFLNLRNMVLPGGVLTC